MQKLDPQVLRSIVESGGVRYKESTNSFVFECPRCSKQIFAINKHEGYWACYKCKEDGFKGRPENALNILFGQPVKTYRELLYGEAKIQLQQEFTLDLLDIWSDEMSPNPFLGWDLTPVTWPNYYLKSSSYKFAPGRKYLNEVRGLNDEIIEKYDIRYNASRNSVIFPVIYEGRLYGWQERGCAPGSTLKFTMPGLNRSKALMFYDNLENSKHAIICEGPVDGLKLNYQGGVVVAMGKEVTEYQLELVKNKVNTVYLALDPDAFSTTSRLCRELTGTHKVFIMTPPNGKKDFGECTFNECQQAFDSAEGFSGQFALSLKGFYGR